MIKISADNMFVVTRLVSLLMSQSIVLLLVFYLNSTDFGSLGLLLSIAQFVIMLVVAWHSGTVLNHGQKYFSQTSSLHTVLLFRGLITLVMVMVFIGVSNEGFKVWVNDFTGLDNGYYLLVLFVVTECTFDLFQNILVVYGKLLINSLAILILKGICFFYVLLFFESLENYFEFSLIFHISYSVFIASYLFMLDRPAVKKIAFDRFPELSKFSLWAIFTSSSVVIANQAYNYIMRWSGISLSEIGAHNLAFRAFIALSVLVYFVRVFYARSLYSRYGVDRLRFVRATLERFLAYYLVLASVGYLFVCIAVYYITVFLPDDAGYDSSVAYMLLYFPAFVLFHRAQFLSVLVTNSLFYKYENIAFVTMSMTGLLANLIFISIFGVYGAIMGSTLGYFVFNILIKRFMNASFYLSLRRLN